MHFDLLLSPETPRHTLTPSICSRARKASPVTLCWPPQGSSKRAFRFINHFRRNDPRGALTSHIGSDQGDRLPNCIRDLPEANFGFATASHIYASLVLRPSVRFSSP
jgi:hypothetical protein